MTESEADTIIAEALEASARVKPKIDEMIRVVIFEAARVEASQRALLLADMRVTPHNEAIRCRVVLNTVVDFLEAVRTRPSDVARKLSARAQV